MEFSVPSPPPQKPIIASSTMSWNYWSPELHIYWKYLKAQVKHGHILSNTDFDEWCLRKTQVPSYELINMDGSNLVYTSSTKEKEKKKNNICS